MHVRKCRFSVLNLLIDVPCTYQENATEWKHLAFIAGESHDTYICMENDKVVKRPKLRCHAMHGNIEGFVQNVVQNSDIISYSLARHGNLNCNERHASRMQNIRVRRACISTRKAELRFQRRLRSSVLFLKKGISVRSSLCGYFRSSPLLSPRALSSSGFQRNHEFVISLISTLHDSGQLRFGRKICNKSESYRSEV